MTHLRTVISEQQDSMVSAPVRLLRLLVRTDDANVRKQMLRQKLVDVAALTVERERAETAAAMARGDAPVAAPLPPPDLTNAGAAAAAAAAADADGSAMATMSPQCVHIVVSAVESWGAADVTAQQLEDTITDVLSQVRAVRAVRGSAWMGGARATSARRRSASLTALVPPPVHGNRCAAPAARRRRCRR
jgi:hypothetical protein